MSPIPSQPLKFQGYDYKTIEGTIIKEKLGFRKTVEKGMNERKEPTDVGNLFSMTQGLLRVQHKGHNR